MSLMDSLSSLFDAFGFDFSVSDHTYPEELQFQEALAASLNVLTNYVSSSSSSSQICCQICFEEKEKQEMFQIQGCSHSFCSVCVTKHVESKLQDNTLNISCLSEDCDHMIEPESLKPIVPAVVIARWEKELSESTILPSEKYYCPFTDCTEILINDGNEGSVIRESECPWCSRLFCAYCNVPWHQGLSCEKFKRSKKGKREKNELRLLAKVNKWKKCPKCRVYVEKTEGCIHITCRCKFEFCYVCGKKWNESHFTTCQT